MERKLVRFTTIFTCIFSAFICVVVWYLPKIEHDVEAFGASIIQDRREREERYAMLQQMSGLEIMDYNTQQVQEKAAAKAAEAAATEAAAEAKGDEEVPEKNSSDYIKDYIQDMTMRLELPENTKGEDVEIVSRYIDQQIEIRIPGADENYIYDYEMIGESDEIESLDYSSEGDHGTIVLTMSKVVEVESEHDDDHLYLDFLAPKEVYDRVVVVDAGHGGQAPGAVSGDNYEKNITLAIVQKVKELFDEEKGSKIGVYYTRLDDSNPDFSNRVGLANNADADLFVSVHINSLKGHTSVEGIEVMYDELAADTAFDTKDFAQICLDETQMSMGAKKRGLISGNKIYIIRNSNVPVALIEVGFMNNPVELSRLLDPSYQQKAAQGIYNAVHTSIERLDEIDKANRKKDQ